MTSPRRGRRRDREPDPTRVTTVLPSPVRRLGGHVAVVPGWGVVSWAASSPASLVIVGVLLSKPSDAAVEDDTQAAQSAAERAIVPLLSYDASTSTRAQRPPART